MPPASQESSGETVSAAQTLFASKKYALENIPAAQARGSAKKYDESAIKYATEGDWKRALQLIKAMR